MGCGASQAQLQRKERCWYVCVCAHLTPPDVSSPISQQCVEVLQPPIYVNKNCVIIPVSVVVQNWSHINSNIEHTIGIFCIGFDPQFNVNLSQK